MVKLEELKGNKYLISVIDATAKKEAKGRSIIIIGNHSEDGNLEYSEKKKFPIPFSQGGGIGHAIPN